MAAQDKLLLIGIGGRRCGSTWLARYLEEHPDVFISPLKELEHFNARLKPDVLPGVDTFFAKQMLKLMAETGDGDPARAKPEQLALLDALKSRIRAISDKDEYLNFFVSRVGDRHVMCEITPEYSLLDSAHFEQMASIYPIVRFLFVMRNPIDRYWSDLALEAKRGGGAANEAEIFEMLDQVIPWLRCDYGRTLREIFAGVEREHVHIEFFEDLFCDPAMERLCQFLGISFRAGRYDARVHGFTQSQIPRRLRGRLYGRLAKCYEAVDAFFSGNIPATWRNDMAAFG